MALAALWSVCRSLRRKRKTLPKRGFWRADEGTRTLDLLHGKEGARADWRRLEPTNWLSKAASHADELTRAALNRQKMLATQLAKNRQWCEGSCCSERDFVLEGRPPGRRWIERTPKRARCPVRAEGFQPASSFGGGGVRP